MNWLHSRMKIVLVIGCIFGAPAAQQAADFVTLVPQNCILQANDLYKFPGSGTYSIAGGSVFNTWYQVKIMNNVQATRTSPWIGVSTDEVAKTHSGSVPEDFYPAQGEDRWLMQAKLSYNKGGQRMTSYSPQVLCYFGAAPNGSSGK